MEYFYSITLHWYSSLDVVVIIRIISSQIKKDIDHIDALEIVKR